MSEQEETILLVRVGDEDNGGLHISELTLRELCELARDCQDEMERRLTGASI